MKRVPPLFRAIIENDAKLDKLRHGRVVPITHGHAFRELRNDRARLNAAAEAALQRDTTGRRGAG